MFLVSVKVSAQVFKETITKELSFEKNAGVSTLIVANLNGFVKVEGYNGDKVLIKAERVIEAKSTEKLETGKREIGIGNMNLTDTILLYVDRPCYKIKKNKHGSWGYDGNDCNQEVWRKGDPYVYSLNFIIQVPYDVNIVLSTINQGDIEASNMKASITANNVNGNIKLDHIKGKTIARTVNGNVDLNYDAIPVQNCQYYTLNGAINANFPSRLTADFTFKTFQGDLYTNIDKIERLPALIEEKKGEGTKYKIIGSHYRAGKGGVLLDFETFNGNVYLKEGTAN